MTFQGPCPPSSQWKYYVIFIIAIVTLVTGAVSWAYAAKLNKSGQETHVENITKASMGTVFTSMTVIIVTGLAIFAKKQIQSGLIAASARV